MKAMSVFPALKSLKPAFHLESDRSFTSYEAALAHVTGPRLPSSTELYWDQAMLDVLFDYPIHSDQARFSIHLPAPRPAGRTCGHRGSVPAAQRLCPRV